MDTSAKINLYQKKGSKKRIELFGTLIGGECAPIEIFSTLIG